ncbi:TetR/AcrR family transcriptional regulator [Gammaproteobacteria bacterium]|jgi:AcrR family transcriptional regulator|nr:TetR/AcrR family transcriptional regulator [Gammaproteobacteria bacterium]
MHVTEKIKIISGKSVKPLTDKHKQVIDKLELMLEKGIPDLTMSELAAKLKVSLRTLYEIAPSKDHLIRMTVNRILMKLGKEALDIIANINSPVEKLKRYLQHANQAVGPKFKVYLQNLGNNNKSKEMIDYHEDYIISFTKELLDAAVTQKEISAIDTQAFALLLGGIGRDFAKDVNVAKLSDSPEKSANSITEIILNGIRLEK